MAMRGISGDAHFFEESMNLDRIRKLLDNKLGVAGHSEKLEAMKALLASISKGEDVSMFFADVVKNVIVASVEVKKLVYMYLVHYADANAQCRELALLSINSFQKDLADGNQLIRALALRVMTSIRVRDIMQIQLIAIRKCAADSSPYVRKCAANALSKVFVVDPEQKDVLAEIIGKLLSDSSTMVLGSAVQAFNEVCPDRLDLLHRPFRKICHLLADIDEWGQVATINVLIRYCREQFQTPEVLSQEEPGRKDTKNLFPKRKTKRGFYSDDERDSDSDREANQHKSTQPSPFHLGSNPVRGEVLPSIGSVFRSNAIVSGFSGGEELDEDHRLLLRSSIPLLKSRNSAVVLAVATLHYYCGTHSVATNTLIGKSLVRIMRNQREIQFVVLSVISSMSISRPAMFRPFLQDFFVRATDPSYARKLKLEILTTLVTDENVSIILREFQAYVRHVDKAFVTMTVRALGRVADAMPSVAERCLSGLMRLVRSNSDQVVSESVVVIRQLLQQSTIDKDRNRVIRSLAAMMVSGRVSSPSARASILWLLGEFHQEGNGSVCAAETLRLIVKNFADEATEVRLQVLNLAVKLGLREPQKRNIQLLLQYVIELCKFDPDYDVRDRARLVRAALSGDANIVNPHKLFASKKPAPLIGCEEESKSRFTLGTLSGVVRHSVPGYSPLPTWRTEKPDRKLRDESSFVDDVREDNRNGNHHNKNTKKPQNRGFYSDDDSESDSSGSGSESERTSEEEYESSEGSEYSGSEDESGSGSEDESEEYSSEESEEEESSEESESERRRRNRKDRKAASSQKQSSARQQPAAQMDLLDPLGFLDSSTAPSNSNNFGGGFLSAPSAPSTGNNLLGDLMSLSLAGSAGPATKRELLSASSGNGLLIEYSFLRQPSMYSPNMNLVQLWLSNQRSEPISRIQVTPADDDSKVVSFPEIPVLFPGSGPSMAQIHVDFSGRLDKVPLNVITAEDEFEVELVPVSGELLVPHQMNLDEFMQRISMADSSALHTTEFALPPPVQLPMLVQATLKDCNVAQVYEINNVSGAAGRCKFAGRIRGGSGEIVLIGMDFQIQSGKSKLLVVSTNLSLAQRISASIKRNLPISQG
ncbi:hypothetical protein Poli38472_012798 [Pythium oligandrum]|uniref:AP-3 complex subunit beta n=1 Tax=Pythium oligandrum TaxID=41045 RepID=A0A8K1FJB0_PYTOL|nr:hypothetical protein Poli38472_012798 [Pythium oligandrum]|eukprot:TMW61607.1 hypothetical protein Poli38472_012798 [Pythium oligandrum]